MCLVSIKTTMKELRITREFSFEMAHFLPGYDGPCKNIHGHSFRLLVTVSGKPLHEPGNPQDGMVMDFKQLKNIVTQAIINKYDHALLVKKGWIQQNNQLPGFQNIIETDYQPTSELLILHFAQIIQSKLPERVSLFSLRLYETANSFVEWQRSESIG